MPIIDLQRRLAEIGRIRIGQQVPTKGGKTRPEKLTTFRLTSADKVRIEHAASLWGGTPQQWQAPAGAQWEVITQADALDVIVPPSDMSFSQHYELWSAGGCQRRCDGRTEQITQGPCLCDPDEQECDIHTRLSVMLRDLPGLGVWRIDTSGYYAAVELQGAVQVIQVAAGHGHMLPARLRLEQRQVKRQVDGKPQTRNFPVPVLDVEVSPGQLMARSNSPEVAPTSAEGQIDGVARLTPVPASLTEAPVRSIAEQAAEVDEGAPRPRRRNAAAALPSTGLQPRTAAQAAADQPAQAAAPAPQTTKQLQRMQIEFKRVGINTHDDRVAFSTRALGREVTDNSQLTYDETSAVIQWLEKGPTKTADPEPVEDNFTDAAADQPPTDPTGSDQ